jgi:hypothetical protein
MGYSTDVRSTERGISNETGIAGSSELRWVTRAQLIAAALFFLGFCLVPGTAFAASTGDTHEAVEKTIPQGKDPPATDEEQRNAPPAEHKA